MAEDRRSFKIRESETGHVQVTDEVIAIIAGLSATEVDGVASMAGNITKDIISRLGMKNLSRGVRIETQDNAVVVLMALNIAYGYSLPEVSAAVQRKVKTAVENMTGLEVAAVNIRIADVDMKTEK
ncbi:MAG: Asp23/Gls24 family envelope stress response protein [Eubacterium sp.]|nr:Asp23/Gls24 family envelope stress response protein [Lachnospiraceae bacterium]MBQ7447880.1 Asp23/Gls24 family envelope stress response protein [Eubacterium sp.]